MPRAAPRVYSSSAPMRTRRCSARATRRYARPRVTIDVDTPSSFSSSPPPPRFLLRFSCISPLFIDFPSAMPSSFSSFSDIDVFRQHYADDIFAKPPDVTFLERRFFRRRYAARSRRRH
jgi:hypothetical protein